MTVARSRVPALGVILWSSALTRATELLLVGGLLVLAAAIRWPYLWQIPELTDETSEIWRAYLIYRGEIRPLTNITTFVGPLWNYLVAALFWVSGPSVFSPRLLVMAIGVLTVIPTYLLGREIGGQRAGLIAALFLATNASHVVSNSHIAWSSCTTPFFGTFAFWLLARAVSRRSGPLLVAAGLLSGLALLTHGTFAFLLPGLALFVLWRGRVMLATRWAVLALTAFLIGFWPLIVFNLTSGFETVDEAAERAERDRGTALPAFEAYLQRHPVVLSTALRVASGAIDGRDGGLVDYLRDPFVWAYGLTAAAGLVAAWRAGQPLPGLIVASGLLVWPLFNQKVDSLPQEARYLFPLVPPLFAAGGLLLSRLLDRAVALGVGQGAAVSLGIAVLAAYPLVPLWRYYDARQADGRVNEVGYAMVASVGRHHQPDEKVLLDAGIDRYSFGGNGAGQRAFRQLLGMQGIKGEDRDFTEPLSEYVECGRSALFVMRAMEFRKLGEQAASLKRDGIELSVLDPPGQSSPVFGLYRVTRTPCSERQSRGRR